LAWQLASSMIMLTTVWLLLSHEKSPRYPPMLLPLGLFLLFFGPSFLTLQIGALGAFTLGTILVSMYALQHERQLLAGVALSLTLLKPPQAVPILVLACVWFVARRSWPAIAGIGVGAAALLVTGWALDAHWIAKFSAVGSALVERSLGLHANTFGLAYHACSGSEGCMWITGGVAAAAILTLTSVHLWKHAHDASPWEALNLIVPTAFVSTLYLWSYDQVLYLLPIVWIVLRLIDRTGSYVAPVLFLAVLVLVSFASLLIQANTRSDLLSAVTSALVISGCLALRSGKSIASPRSSDSEVGAAA
jgi:hypothetical protein